jgi:hypothetical protein
MRNPPPPPVEVIDFIGPAASDYQWHGTNRELGGIQGIKDNLVLIASNGSLGVFVDSSGKLFLGHVEFFSGKVKTAET